MHKGKENKPHIGIFGRRNYGKSSLINMLAGQDIAIVSDKPGTTTDPVKKTVEITRLGPVVFIDTAGIDDTGDLGDLRISKSLKALEMVDMAVLVIAGNTLDDYENDLIEKFNTYNIPYLIIHNKSDVEESTEDFNRWLKSNFSKELIDFSTLKPDNSIKEELIEKIRITLPDSVWIRKSLVGDLVSYGDVVLLITPIDIEAPEGRLILPQVQTIRDILDNDCTAIIVKEREVDAFLRNTKIRPKLVVTDSQVFLKADASIPEEIPLTSFSILLARQKGDFYNYIKGTPSISKLKDGDRVLLLESCTHHVSCDDIGRVKIPRWISNFTGKKIEFDTVSGLDDLIRPIEDYSLVIQCGGCMITQKQLQNRLRVAVAKKIPVSNYGMAIAYVQGIFNRAVAPFTKSIETEDYL